MIEVPGTKSSTLRFAKFTEGQNLRRGQKCDVTSAKGFSEGINWKMIFDFRLGEILWLNKIHSGCIGAWILELDGFKKRHKNTRQKRHRKCKDIPINIKAPRLLQKSIWIHTTYNITKEYNMNFSNHKLPSKSNFFHVLFSGAPPKKPTKHRWLRWCVSRCVASPKQYTWLIRWHHGQPCRFGPMILAIAPAKFPR